MIGLPSNRGPEPPDWDQKYKGFILLEHPPQASAVPNTPFHNYVS